MRGRRGNHPRQFAQDSGAGRLLSGHGGDGAGSPGPRADPRLRLRLHRSENAGHVRNGRRQVRETRAPGHRRGHHHRLRVGRHRGRGHETRRHGLRGETLLRGRTARVHPECPDQAAGPDPEATPAPRPRDRASGIRPHTRRRIHDSGWRSRIIRPLLGQPRRRRHRENRPGRLRAQADWPHRRDRTAPRRSAGQSRAGIVRHHPGASAGGVQRAAERHGRQDQRTARWGRVCGRRPQLWRELDLCHRG